MTSMNSSPIVFLEDPLVHSQPLNLSNQQESRLGLYRYTKAAPPFHVGHPCPKNQGTPRNGFRFSFWFPSRTKLGGSLTGCEAVPLLDPSEVQRLIVDLLWADPRGKTGYGPSYRVRHWWQMACVLFCPGSVFFLLGCPSFPNFNQQMYVVCFFQHRVQRLLISKDVVCFVISKSAGGNGVWSCDSKGEHHKDSPLYGCQPKSGTHQQSYSPQATCTFVAEIAPQVGSPPPTLTARHWYHELAVFRNFPVTHQACGQQWGSVYIWTHAHLVQNRVNM